MTDRQLAKLIAKRAEVGRQLMDLDEQLHIELRSRGIEPIFQEASDFCMQNTVFLITEPDACASAMREYIEEKQGITLTTI